ncbi:MAG: hypothetical protein WA184_12145, partial [Stellaceae bacterium]
MDPEIGIASGRQAAPPAGRLSSRSRRCKLWRIAREEQAMPIEPMLTEETPANALVARVLEEAGIEMV